MEPKTKQSLLVTVVGVTLFVALLRLSDVLAFAAKLIDLVLPILAGGILALFINVPMTGLEKRLNRLFGKAKKQPSAKAIHLLSFFITLLGVVLVLVLALTLLIPELGVAFVTSKPGMVYPGKPYRRVRLDALSHPENKARLRFRARMTGVLREEAIAALQEAKAAHDLLEGVYNPYVDFEGVRAQAALEAGRLLSWMK